MFQNIVSVDKDEHVVTISENLNAILDEVGSCNRSRDHLLGGQTCFHLLTRLEVRASKV